MTPSAGFHTVDFETYRSWDALNVSSLKDFEVSPSVCKHNRDAPKKVTDAMVKGSAGDCLALEGALEFEKHYAVIPAGTVRNEKHEKYQKFLEKAGDRQPITKAVFDAAWPAAQAFRDHPEIAPLLERGDAQLSMVWQCPITGIWCKGRPDLYAAPVFLDMKITEYWHPLRFGSQMAKMRWHWQAYWYCWGASILHEFTHDDFRFGAVMPKAPHIVQVHRTPFSAMELARAQIEPLVVQYAECLAADRWPAGYTEAVFTDLPEWEYRKGEGA